MSLPCFGLHVGNTTACLAVSKEGKVEVVASPTGDRVTPATVAFQDTEVIVGLAAKQGRARNITNTIVNNKRLLFADQVNEEVIQASPVSIAADKGGGGYLYTVDFKERDFEVSPAEVLGHILQYFHSIASSHTNSDTPVSESITVLTVPIVYSEEQRARLTSIAIKAGFKVAQCISEPAAACLAYAESLGRQATPATPSSGPERCLVIRVGGISSDLTLVEVAGGAFSVLETEYFPELGGAKFTSVLVEHFAKEFKAKFKDDIRHSKRGMTKLSAQAEVVKHVLSSLDTAHCYVESLFDGMDFSSNVTRARFDSLVSNLISDILGKVSALLARAGLKPGDVGSVLLAGGCTKVIRLQSQVGGLLPNAEVLSSLAGDEVGAVGAASQASLLKQGAVVWPGLAQTMPSLAKDLVCVVSPGEAQVVLVPRGTPLPVRRSVPLTLPEECEAVVVSVCWGSAQSPLASLSLECGPESKLAVVVHLHRDTGAAHITLQDKAKGTSTDVHLK